MIKGFAVVMGGWCVAFLVFVPIAIWIGFCAAVMCALQCAKNSVGQGGNVLGCVKLERSVPIG